MSTVPRAPSASAPTAQATAIPLTRFDGAASAGSRKQKRGGSAPGKVMTVGEFVDASFASFEKAFPGTVMTAPKATGTGVTASNGSLGSNASRYPPPLRCEEDGEEEFDEEEDGEDGSAAFLDRASFLTLLTTLYVPLLLLWLRRSMFGTASLLRSLLIGHALRLLLAYAIVLPDVPPAWASDLSGRVRKTAAWRYVVGMGVFLIEAIVGPEDGHGGVQGGSGGQNHRGGAETWPPPALMVLAVFTVVAFIVHPDGLTWIMLGKMRDGIKYCFESAFLCLNTVRDGTIPTVVASSSLGGLLILAGIIHRVLSSKQSHSPSPHPERSRQKGKKGKKGRGRHGGGGNYRGSQARGRGRIRGGHYRSAKDLASSPEPCSRSRSRSSSPSSPRKRIGHDSTINTIPEVKNSFSDKGRVPAKHDKYSVPRCEMRQSSSIPESPRLLGSGSSIKMHRTATPTKQSAATEGPGRRVGGANKSPGTNNAGVNGGGRRRRRGKKGPKHSSGSAVGTKLAASDLKAVSTLPPLTPSRLPLSPSPTLRPPPPPMQSSTVIAPPKSAQGACLPGISQFSSPRFLTAPTPPPSPLVSVTPSLSLTRPSGLKESSLSSNVVKTGKVQNMPESDNRICSFFSSGTPPLLVAEPSYINEGLTGGRTKQILQPIGGPPLLGSSSLQHTSFQVAPGPSPSQLYGRSLSAPLSKLPTQQHSLYGFSQTAQPLASNKPVQQFPQRNMPPVNLAPGSGLSGIVSGLRYSGDNYASTHPYSQCDGRYAPGKIDLAAFLAQVGLEGTACAGLLAGVVDVDALARLTDSEFEAYNVSSGKKKEILALLQARRYRQIPQTEGAKKQQQQWTAGMVRPPPGLELNRDDSKCVGLVAVDNTGEKNQQHLPFLMSEIPGSDQTVLPAYHFSNELVNVPSDPRNRCGTSDSWSRASDDATKGTAVYFATFGHTVSESTEDDSKIEADLLELGGQMVGSVLDF